MGWSQIFLKISFEKAGLVEGESEVTAYEKQIVLLDFDWSLDVASEVIKGIGVNRQITRRLSAKPLTMTKRFDISSTALCSAVATRDLITSARITVAQSFAVQGKSGLRDAFVIEVKNAYLESVDLDMVADGKSMVLQENLSIRYSELNVEVTPVGRDGQYAKAPTFFKARFNDTLTLV